MLTLNRLFLTRIGLSEREPVTFGSLPKLLERTARAIPFDNLRIIGGTTCPVTKESLIERIAVNREGGLCYELNPLLYFFLLEHGFEAVLVRGIVYNHSAGAYAAAGRTHILILLAHEGQRYVIDTGFGGNLPLRPVPLSGAAVASDNGEFRVAPIDLEVGDYALEMKLKHKDTDWRVGYAFDSRRPVTDLSELSEVQAIVARHEASPFNKHPLITKRTERGSITLTDHGFTQWIDGAVTRTAIDHETYLALLHRYFGRVPQA